MLTKIMCTNKQRLITERIGTIMIHNGKPELECVLIRIPAVAKLYSVFLKKFIISLWLHGNFLKKVKEVLITNV